MAPFPTAISTHVQNDSTSTITIASLLAASRATPASPTLGRVRPAFVAQVVLVGVAAVIYVMVLSQGGVHHQDFGVYLAAARDIVHGQPLYAAFLHHPFPDATPEFFRALEGVVNRAVEGRVRIELPFAGLHKTDVMRRGKGLPLQHSFSCIRPKNGLHCGRCNKCGERRQAFAAAGLADPTHYAH